MSAEALATIAKGRDSMETGRLQQGALGIIGRVRHIPAKVGVAAAALALGGAVLLSPHSAFADQRDLTLVNRTGQTITHVYVSASDRGSWEEDVLGRNVLPAGRSTNIRFSSYDADAWKCFYDIRVRGASGAEGTMYQVNLCSTSTVPFS